jgi:hypothetical protein
MAGSYSKKDPSSHRTIDQIRKMDAGYNHRPDIIKNRSDRNKARRMMAKARGAEAIRGKDVNHKKKVIDGGKTVMSNLNIQTPHKNRGWERDE